MQIARRHSSDPHSHSHSKRLSPDGFLLPHLPHGMRKFIATISIIITHARRRDDSETTATGQQERAQGLIPRAIRMSLSSSLPWYTSHCTPGTPVAPLAPCLSAFPTIPGYQTTGNLHSKRLFVISPIAPLSMRTIVTVRTVSAVTIE